MDIFSSLKVEVIDKLPGLLRKHYKKILEETSIKLREDKPGGEGMTGNMLKRIWG